MPNPKRYELAVIGTGPAGQAAALEAAKNGKKTAIIERRRVVGGICLHAGTIPSKTLRETVLYLTGWRLRNIYGSSHRVKSRVTMADLIFRTNFVISKEMEVIKNHMAKRGVEVLYGDAKFVNERQAALEGGEDNELIEAENFIIASGTTAYRSPDICFNDASVIDSDQLYEVKELPERLTILGAGVIGIEYASIFSALDIDVTVISRSPNFFGFVDQEITNALAYHLRNRGVNLRMSETVAKIEFDAAQKPTVKLQSGKQVKADLVMAASGRSGTAGALGLENAGVKYNERGLIEVDGSYRTNVPHIYAAGDIIGFPSLASTSKEQGRRAALNMLGLPCESVTDFFPYGIYSIPEIAYIGRTEEELTAAGTPYESGVARYREVAKGEILGDDTGMLKLLFHREDKKLLGVHGIGADLTEIIHIGQAVMSFGGTIDYFINNVFNYPTLSESYKIAALDALSKM